MLLISRVELVVHMEPYVYQPLQNKHPSSVQPPLQRISESLEQWQQIRHKQDKGISGVIAG